MHTTVGNESIHWPENDQIVALAHLRIGSTLEQAEQFMALLGSRGFGEPVRQDLVEDDEAPPDIGGSVEYLIGYPASASLDSEDVIALAYVGVSEAQLVTGASLSWTLGQCTLATQAVSLVEQTMQKMETVLGKSYASYLQGEEWVAAGCPADSVIGTICWSHNAKPVGKVKTADEYRKSCETVEVGTGMRLMATRHGNRGADKWLIQAILMS